MDFFSAVAHSEQAASHTDAHDVQAFAAAVVAAHQPTPAIAIPSFAAVAPTAIQPYLDDPHALVVDIRPHAAHADARLHQSLSLSVPSTLLRRPLFPLDRLAAMLSSSSARSRLSSFKDSSCIIVYDADSSSISESSNIHGLLRKFKAAGFAGELAWLRGGFQAVWRDHRRLIDVAPLHDDEDDSSSSPDRHHSRTTSFSNSPKPRRPPNSHRSSISMHMPMPRSAPTNPFFDAVRQNIELSSGITEHIPLRLPARVRRRIHDLPFLWLQEIAKHAARAPHNHIHHRRTLSLPTSPTLLPPTSPSDTSDTDDASPTSASIREGTEALAMQFYRIELAEQRRLMGIMAHHSHESESPLVELGKIQDGQKTALPFFPFSITAGVEKGAKNRYRHIWPFEHARVRLLHPSSPLDAQLGQSEPVPYHKPDISLPTQIPDEDDDDYVNASYVQPLGTNRRYIATQGPLDATFDDFWRLTWQQNVHVIVMLTREIEGSMVKCGAYWADTNVPERKFGPLTLKLVGKVGLPAGVDLMHEAQAQAQPQDGFGFGVGIGSASSSKKPLPHITTIKRIFHLSHASYPSLGPRTVMQLQYLEWPDMNVPENASGVLSLVEQVQGAMEDTDMCASPKPGPGPSTLNSMLSSEKGGKRKSSTALVDPISGIARHALGGCRPVLLHCSAGVGRTGGFIAIDAVLDAVRREYRLVRVGERRVDSEASAKELNTSQADAMDVDVAPTLSPGAQDDKGVVTVSLPVSNSDVSVLHVPAVVVPTSTGALEPPCDRSEDDTTPMPVDSVESSRLSPSGDSEESRPTALTRKWAEGVLDSCSPSNDNGDKDMDIAGEPGLETMSTSAFDSGSGPVPDVPTSMFRPPFELNASSSSITPALLHQFQPTPQNPRRCLPALSLETALQSQQPGVSSVSPTASTSSISASVFPSLSDSEDSRTRRVNRMRGGSGSEFSMGRSSSLATSVSGGSVGSKNEIIQRIEDAERGGKGKGRESDVQRIAQQRFRTFSAPQRMATDAKFGFSFGAGGSGSSPLVQSSEIGASQLPAAFRSSQTLPTDMQPSSSFTSATTHPPTSFSSTAPLVSSAFPSHGISPTSSHPSRADYNKEPRALHGALVTPVALHGFEEPIWEVVQDMREQRMSLCQSLRQYVFVHQVIIEGALRIVDEERKREDEDGSVGDGKGGKVPGEKQKEGDEMMVATLVDEEQKRRVAEDAYPLSESIPFSFGSNGNIMERGATDSADPHSFSFSTPASYTPHISPSTTSCPSPHLALPALTFSSTSSGITSDSASASSSAVKRGASPTELLKEGKKGEPLLSKRPSIKRKTHSMPYISSRKAESSVSDGHVPSGPQIHQVLGTVPPSPMPL